MKSRLLSLMMLVPAAIAPAAEVLENRPVYFDNQKRFTVEVDVPAGSRHALLESFVPGPPASWRTLVSGPIDGRAARVIFRLPAGFSPREVVRAKTGAGTTVPAAQLDDPSLYSVIYESGIDEQLKFDFLRDASAKMREWSSLPQAEYHAKLIAWAKANNLVASAVVSETTGDISVHFTDGDTCVLLKKKRDSPGFAAADAPPSAFVPPATPLLRPSAAAARLASRSTRDSFAPSGLATPGSKHAVTAHSLESFFPNSAPTIAGWLRTSGYDVKEFSGTTVPVIKSWFSNGPLGVLFWHVHGCDIKMPDGTSKGVGLVTGEYASVALSKGDYKEMRASGELELAGDEGQAVPFYVITSKFVEKYMKFAPNSLVVMDACFGTEATIANSFIAAGVGSYVSWDWESGKKSGESCRKIFDRMLGMNVEAPVSTLKERPFSQSIVEMWMEDKGYDYDPSNKYPNQSRPNARMIWFHHDTNPAFVLRPTIIRVQNYSGPPGGRYSMLWLEGDIGDDPGEGKRNVTWGGQLQEVVQWGPNRIYIRVPNPAPVGNIQVLVNRGSNLLSNPVPITQWTVPFTFVRDDPGSLTEKAELTVKIRADLRGERYFPEEAVIYQEVPFWSIADGSGTYTASGTYSPVQGVTLSYSGGSTMRSYDMRADAPTGEHVIKNSGRLRGDGRFTAFELSGTGDFNSTYTYVLPEGGTHSQDVPVRSGFGDSAFFVPMPSFNPTTYTLNPGDKPLPTGTGTSMTLSWPATGAVAAPTPDTPR